VIFDFSFIAINLLSVARYTGFRRFWISVAAETRRRIDSAVNSVPGKVIPAVGKPVRIFGLIPNGGLQFNPHGVTVVTITLTVAHGASIIILVAHLAVIGRKKAGMIKFAVRKIFF
jgi:hypothetical protein